MSETIIQPDSQPQTTPARPSSEVIEKATRRRFNADYKKRILEEADACKEPGQIGALLRREGLYSSHLSCWRDQRDQAIQTALSTPRGRKAEATNPLAEENSRLRQEIQHLQARLAQANTVIDLQKKLSQLLGLGEFPLNSGISG